MGAGTKLVSCRIQAIDLNGQTAGALPKSEAPKFKYCEVPHSDNDLTHHIVVRGDLTPGQKYAMVVHAAGESVTERVPKETVAVALRTSAIGEDAQDELLQISARLDKAGIRHVIIRECDGESMAIGIEPTRDRKAVRKVLSSLPLLR